MLTKLDLALSILGSYFRIHDASCNASPPRNSSRPWFAGFAPYDSGEIVIVAFAQNTPGGGSVHALPMARKILQTWYEQKSNNELNRSKD